MREFTQLPDGGTRFETDSREDFLEVLTSTLKAGGTFDVLTHGGYAGIIRGVDTETLSDSDAPSPAPGAEPEVAAEPDASAEDTSVEEPVVEEPSPEAPAEDADGSLEDDLLGDTPPPAQPKKGGKK